jgi:hypothetical protein
MAVDVNSEPNGHGAIDASQFKFFRCAGIFISVDGKEY